MSDVEVEVGIIDPEVTIEAELDSYYRDGGVRVDQIAANEGLGITTQDGVVTIGILDQGVSPDKISPPSEMDGRQRVLVSDGVRGVMWKDRIEPYDIEPSYRTSQDGVPRFLKSRDGHDTGWGLIDGDSIPDGAITEAKLGDDVLERFPPKGGEDGQYLVSRKGLPVWESLDLTPYVLKRDLNDTFDALTDRLEAD